MRLMLLGMTLACLGLAVSAGAQGFDLNMFGEPVAPLQPTPSWYGSTGMVRTPSAEVGAPLKLSGGIHRVDLDDNQQDLYCANVAVLADLEVGGAVINDIIPPGAGAYVSETILNAKYRLPLESVFGLGNMPQVAIGIWDASDRINRTYYIVASKTLSLAKEQPAMGLKLHAGLGSGEIGEGPLHGLFGGIEFAPFTGALVQAEYDAENVNLAFRYSPFRWLSADVASIDGDFGWGISAQSTF